MAYVTDNYLFQSLDDAREEEFRQHARDNAPPDDSHWSVLHPVCREEWARRCYGPDKDGKAVYLGLRRSDYQRALDSQSACNLGAIVKALASVVDRIWATERAFKCGGTDWMNTHPIMRLYAEQISHLSGGGMCSNGDTYSTASDACEAGAKDESLPA